jgi:glyoxylase-like metal-dependent hydrolase (beta-lactamase superfamily II)
MIHTTRRDFLRTLTAGAVGMSITYPAFGQGAPTITATKLSPTLVLLSGDGGNVALVIGANGLMLVDGGLPENAAALLKSVSSVDSHPVTTVFNTHWHFDHIGVNETLGKMGAKIIAHENTKKHLSERVTMEALNRTFEPLAAQGRPTETFTRNGRMTFEKEAIVYVHVDPAHTDGDAYVHFTGPNVLHTGDLLFKDTYPVIDYSTGGWIGGMAAACDVMAKVCNAETKVIPGHGALGSRADLITSRDMLTDVQNRLMPMVKQGRSADEVVKAAPTKDLDAKWGKGFMTPDNFVRAAYTSLLRREKK